LPGFRWTDEEKRVLHLVVENGGTVEEAAAILSHRNRCGIESQLRRLGLPLAFSGRGPGPEVNETELKKFLEIRKV